MKKMKWDISDHTENQSTISWKKSTWIIKDKLSSMKIVNGSDYSSLFEFAREIDWKDWAISRRWYLTITDLPDSAKWPQRVINATFFGVDGSVLDGSTFGKISVWEASPIHDNEIVLVVDITKVRSQNHQFGINVQITHNINPVIAVPGKPDEKRDGRRIDFSD